MIHKSKRTSIGRRISGVYFLWYRKKIVYIGAAVCIKSRLYFHSKDKQYSYFTYMEIKDSYKRKQSEYELIREHKPEYNIMFCKYGRNRLSWHESIFTDLQELDLPKRELVRKSVAISENLFYNYIHGRIKPKYSHVVRAKKAIKKL